MNIIILGNGFDLAHGLETNYKDFIHFYQDYINEKIIFCDALIHKKFNKNISSNIWFRFFDGIVKRIDAKNNDDNNKNTWIDFEELIFEVLNSEFIEILTKSRKSEIDYESNSEMFAESINLNFLHSSEYAFKLNTLFERNSKPLILKKNKINTIYESLYSDLRRFTLAFEIYCCFVINSQNIINTFIINKSLFPGQTQLVDYIVSFNYTSTFQKYYGKETLINDEESSYVYLHGKACITAELIQTKKYETNLVLGTQDFDENVHSELKKFEKYTQRDMFNTLKCFQDLLKKIRNNKDKNLCFYVLGHSLDRCDHSLLKAIFTENDNSDIKIFSHNQKSKESYITNMRNMLGESYVNSHVTFYDQHNTDNGLLLLNHTY
jgi:hypothetical protein